MSYAIRVDMYCWRSSWDLDSSPSICFERVLGETSPLRPPTPKQLCLHGTGEFTFVFWHVACGTCAIQPPVDITIPLPNLHSEIDEEKKHVAAIAIDIGRDSRS